MGSNDRSLFPGAHDLLQVEEGSLYPALQRMPKAGWVAADWGVSSRNRKVRIEVSSFEQRLEGIARAMKAVQS